MTTPKLESTLSMCQTSDTIVENLDRKHQKQKHNSFIKELLDMDINISIDSLIWTFFYKTTKCGY